MRVLGYLLFLSCCWGCGRYYGDDAVFRDYVVAGDYERANALLEKNKRVEKKKWRFLHYLDQGTALHGLGEYERSNASFEQAFLLGEDYYRSAGQNIASKMLHAKLGLYRGEEHEHLLVLYFKALNYLLLEDIGGALVEVRRLDIRLRALEDRYKEADPGNAKNRYRRDAFMHAFMGMVYEASGESNDAFVAYRVAYEVYKEDYHDLFDGAVPEQLKADLYRMAVQWGKASEYPELSDYAPTAAKGEVPVVILWSNYPGPRKVNFGVTFVHVPGVGGVAAFESPDVDIAVPFLDFSPDVVSSLADVGSIRLVIPQYQNSKPSYYRATVDYNAQSYDLSMGEDVNAVARKALNQRIWQDITALVIRVATKKVLASALAEENPLAGGALDLFFTATETADTRCWQTIPGAMYYTRLYVPKGKQTFPVRFYTSGGQSQEDIVIDITSNATRFVTLNTYATDR